MRGVSWRACGSPTDSRHHTIGGWQWWQYSQYVSEPSMPFASRNLLLTLTFEHPLLARNARQTDWNLETTRKEASDKVAINA